MLVTKRKVPFYTQNGAFNIPVIQESLAISYYGDERSLEEVKKSLREGNQMPNVRDDAELKEWLYSKLLNSYFVSWVGNTPWYYGKEIGFLTAVDLAQMLKEFDERGECNIRKNNYYSFENGKFLGIANETGDLFIEEFDTRDECFRYLLGAEELYENQTKKVVKEELQVLLDQLSSNALQCLEKKDLTHADMYKNMADGVRMAIDTVEYQVRI